MGILNSLKRSLEIRKKNFRNLRTICDQVGKEFELMPFENLLHNTEEDFRGPTLEYQGQPVTFAGEARLLKNGDISYYLHLHCDVPVILGCYPNYLFYKKRDETVYK